MSCVPTAAPDHDREMKFYGLVKLFENCQKKIYKKLTSLPPEANEAQV